MKFPSCSFCRSDKCSLCIKLLRCSWKIKLRALTLIVVISLVLYISGVTNHLREQNFAKFKYPYEGNIERYVMQLRENKKPSKKAINEYKYKYITNCKEKCRNDTSIRLLFLVKSALNNFDRRFVIRRTWGYERRFSDVEIRTLFLLGSSVDKKLAAQIDKEYLQYKDIIQMNFTDTYYNNTIKTMMGFKWAVTNCQNSKFYMFADDDMYVSTKNVLRYVRHPTKYPEYLSDTQGALNNEVLHRSKRQLVDFELPDGIRFYTGYVQKASPFRNKLSKWYMPLEEYPYDAYPLYATAGAYILSKDALLDMYYASLYTKHFKFDDVYLGILAYKVNILPYHCKAFHLSKVKYTPENYKYLIASHGYENSEELLKVWNEQRDLGNA